jgi:uncharacterized membrane protein
MTDSKINGSFELSLGLLSQAERLQKSLQEIATVQTAVPDIGDRISEVVSEQQRFRNLSVSLKSFLF